MIKIPNNSTHPKPRAEWRTWLKQNHKRSEGIWFVSFKKVTGKPRIEYNGAVEGALCFGWIDSKSNKLDDERSMFWFAPRNTGTGWSKLNKNRIEKLIAAGLMITSGLAKVEAAKQDGTWYALDRIEALEIPSDSAKTLSANKKAKQYFEIFPRSVKRAILEWIANAKKPETRVNHITETVVSAAKNIRANQWRQ